MAKSGRIESGGEKRGSAEREGVREALQDTARQDRDWRQRMHSLTGKDPVTGKNQVASHEECVKVATKDHIRHNENSGG